MRIKSDSLWRHPGFLRFWAGQTVSVCGDHVTMLALPLVAVAVLHARPVEMGILAGAAGIPTLVLGLPAGAWVDRVRRWHVLVGADFARALVLGSIPLANLVGLLGMPYLYSVAICVGIASVFFNVAYQSFLPSLVQREQLVAGNAKLSMSRSVASIAGPGLAGTMVQLLTAPVAIIFDALSFLASGLFIATVGRQEAKPAPVSRRTWADVIAGLRFVAGQPLLRASAGTAGTYNTSRALLHSVYVLYITRELGVTPATLGVLFALVGPGSLIGTFLAAPAARRFGVGPTMIGGIVLAGVANLLVPLTALAGAKPHVVVALLAVASFGNGFGQPFYNVQQVSLRQAVTPDGFLGRVNATMQFVASSTAPLGALIGGLLGQVLGLWPALFVGALGTLLSALWLLQSRVQTVNGLEELAPSST